MPSLKEEQKKESSQVMTLTLNTQLLRVLSVTQQVQEIEQNRVQTIELEEGEIGEVEEKAFIPPLQFLRHECEQPEVLKAALAGVLPNPVNLETYLYTFANIF